MLEMDGQRAVVTGAASGIGLAIAKRILAEGARVLAVDLDATGLEELAGLGAETLVGDVARPDHRDRIVSSGPIDYLVNCAGIIRLSPILEATLDDWRRIMEVNAEAVFFLCQAAVRVIRPSGAIVNVSSSSAKLAPTTEAAAYAASKAAVLSITRSFAYALADRGIRVNAVCPGMVDTPMERQLLEDVARNRGTTVVELRESRHRSVPLGRSASPAEISEVVWFLLSDRSSYMTGQAVNITGGQVMW
jgi:NAD(P)-dependent dehydrogenase (short-subunit alcohol dehydrogenase family)